MANSLDFRVKNGLTVGTNLTVTANASVANTISVGNSTVNSTINSTSYSGVANTANNATYLQGYQWASPPAIGGSSANTGNFTNLNISSSGLINFTGNVSLYSDTTGNGPGDFVIKTYNATGAAASYSWFGANGGLTTSGQVTAGGTGVYANVGVAGYSNTNSGINGQSTSGYGVAGYSTTGAGTIGNSNTNVGIYGYSNTNYGVYGTSNTGGAGVAGVSNSNFGVYGLSNTNYGGYFISNTGWPLGAGNSSVSFFHIDSFGNLGITGSVLSNSSVSTLGGIGAIGQYNMAYGNTSSGYNVGLRNDGSNFYILASSNAGSVTAAGSASFNGYRPFSFNLSTGAVSLTSDGSSTFIGGSTYLTQTLYDNQNTAYYLKPSGTSVLSTLNVNNANANYVAISGQPTVSYQGAWLGWNQSGGTGEANFICQQGGGVGGFNWQQSNTTNGRTTTMTLSGGGSLTAIGSLTAQNGSISANNMLVQGDGTNGYIRPTNSGSTLYLGANNTNYVSISPVGVVTSTGAINCPTVTLPTGTNGTSLNIGNNGRMWDDGNFHILGGQANSTTWVDSAFESPSTYGLKLGAQSNCSVQIGNGNSYNTLIYSTLTVNGNSQIPSLGVGTTATGTTGQIVATQNITAYYSDKRLKDIEGTIPNALDKVSQISGVYFTSNELAESFGYSDKAKQVGVIAQEIKAVMPEVISPAPFDTAYDELGKAYSKSGENYMTVHYDKLVPLLIEAIKELKNEVEELKGQLK